MVFRTTERRSKALTLAKILEAFQDLNTGSTRGIRHAQLHRSHAYTPISSQTVVGQETKTEIIVTSYRYRIYHNYYLSTLRASVSMSKNIYMSF